MVESDTCIRPINPREENARIHPTHAHLIPLATQNRLLGIKDPYMVSEEAKKLEAEKAKLSHWQVRTNNDKSMKENENSKGVGVGDPTTKYIAITKLRALLAAQRRMKAVKDAAAQQGEAVKEIRASMMGLGKSKGNKDDADNRDQGITDLNVEKAFMRGDVEAAWAQVTEVLSRVSQTLTRDPVEAFAHETSTHILKSKWPDM